MDVSETSVEFLEKKRAELRNFFSDSKFTEEVIEKIIENELRPLENNFDENRPYISASAAGEVKSEYEVMTGQPFTTIVDSTEPFTSEEVKKMLENNPIIIEKSRQIQIASAYRERSEWVSKDICVPLDRINLPCYSEMKDEMNSVGDDLSIINNIRYKNMQALKNCALENAECMKGESIKREIYDDVSHSDDSEFEAIDKVVAEYTNKSYETRFQETKEMLLALAEKYENPITNEKMDSPRKMIKENCILEDSSSSLIENEPTRRILDEIKEEYSINEIMNIPLVYTPVNLDSSSKAKRTFLDNLKGTTKDNDVSFEEVFPKSFESKLKDTTKVLNNINSILTCGMENKSNSSYQSTCLDCQAIKSFEQNNESNQKLLEENNKESDIITGIRNNDLVTSVDSQSFDERMEQTLHSALETILDVGENENRENKNLEFEEMKNLARNIVEGAENLSTFIRSDITNKLNSMNELLNDVNEALENSKKSNILYQNLMKDNQSQRNDDKIHDKIKARNKNAIDNDDNNLQSDSVTFSEIDKINNAIGALNKEIKCHEDRIHKSEKYCEARNIECNEFIKEVDKILDKSNKILHPKQNSNALTLSEHVKDICNEKSMVQSYVSAEKGENKKLSEFQKQEIERSKRIDGLLHDIKDKMKDNKEVRRLADKLLRRGELKNKVSAEFASSISPDETIDPKAQGDFLNKNDVQTNLKINDTDKGFAKTEIATDMDTKEHEEKKKKEAEEKTQKQKEFQAKLDKEMEEANRGPRMTKEFIRNLCKQHKLYRTPHLNDILYLHFKGFSKIENLDEYTGLKCLFLENNGIERIEGLENQSELKCLYLHYNVVRKIENLQGCPKLDTLNLDHNFVPKIENLDVVPDLHTLSIAHNMLSTVADLEHLVSCKNLSVLDLSYNRLEDPLIVDILADMAILKVLVLTGNPVVRNIPAYRKTLTLRLKELLNLDNRPVFPRDRACAEAWQRGGVQEEIAERKRWIAADHEKTMKSVRYLIKMREDKKAEREAMEKEERKKLGLPPKEEDSRSEKEPGEVDELDGPPALEEPFESSAVETKGGVAIDMLTGSEEEDPTSNESDSDSDCDNKKKEDEIVWSQGTTKLVQEIEVDPSTPPLEDYWCGYRGDLKSTDGFKNKTITEFEAINNLLFSQTPRTDNKSTATTFKGVNERSNEIEIIKELQSNVENYSEGAIRKPLIEIIDNSDDTNIIDNININGSKNRVSISEIPKNKDAQNDIRDKEIQADKIIAISNERNKMVCSEEGKNNENKYSKRIDIKEIKREEINVTKLMDNNGDTDTTKLGHDSEGRGCENKSEEKTEACATSCDEPATGKSTASNQGDGVALIRYLCGNDNEDDDEDLKPSAEDLEIFAELEKEQQEREARIARGELAVDPMKLYDKDVMEAYHKAQECTPAHELLQQNKSKVTTYKLDNAFDRIALSQLTAGDKPDEKKIKLTQVPGALLFQYVDNEMQYDIGEETINSSSSSEDLTSGNEFSNTDSSDKQEAGFKPAKEGERTFNRPATVKSAVKPADDSIKVENDDTKEKNEDTNENAEMYNKNTELANETEKGCDELESLDAAGGTEDVSKPSTSFSAMLNVDRDEAKQSIINTINSYDDDRFPSHGTNYADMAENSRIEESVASEILDRTLKYKEQEFYRQYDLINSHAGKIDNRTNSIIEHISDQLAHEYSLPEVSRVLEAHMEATEQRWRAGEFVPYALEDSPPDSIVDDNETTLIPSHDSTFEDTLIDEQDIAATTEIKDFGITKTTDKLANKSDDIDESSKDLNKTLAKDLVVDEQKVEEHESSDVFEDCVASIDTKLTNINKDEFDCSEETYTLEMKLALERDG
ncbi:unnamed protein product [Parnassius apollo]|uniref:Dynein axonemal assembly factor 1 homolog n=1 Tax=Parnassius apollo TaxID=110799 RepID=A0A8S3XKX2_PARAO|nr:unnamed protein product [Parnassius apollo]